MRRRRGYGERRWPRYLAAGAGLVVASSLVVTYQNDIWSVRSPRADGEWQAPILIYPNQAKAVFAPPDTSGQAATNLPHAAADKVTTMVNTLRGLPASSGCPDLTKVDETSGEIIKLGQGASATVACLDFSKMTTKSAGGETWAVVPATTTIIAGHLLVDMAQTYANATPEQCTSLVAVMNNIWTDKTSAIDPEAGKSIQYPAQMVLDATAASKCDGPAPAGAPPRTGAA